MPTGDYVRVSSHACDRAISRIAVLDDRRTAMSYVALQAGLALREGRKARRLPRWCVRPFPNGDPRQRDRLRQEGIMRFLWDEAESMVMLVRKMRHEIDGSPMWLVITVMTPGDEAA